MATPDTTTQPKKKRVPGVLGCDQCRRRKTKCDQGKPTCGPCLTGGLMECTFLLGKPAPPKRKKAHTEVEILQERLQTMEAAYSERLSQMEALLNKAMPGAKLDLDKELSGPSKAQPTTAKKPMTTTTTHTSHLRQSTTTNDSEWADSDSTPDVSQAHASKWTHRSPGASAGSLSSPSKSNAPKEPGTRDGDQKGSLLTLVGRGVPPPRSPSTATDYSCTPDEPLIESDDDDDGDGDGDLGELENTMTNLRLFDASYYLGKGTVLFSTTDQNEFWNEEITFDVHDIPDFAIPPEAFELPPVEVIDALIEIYYTHYYVFLPMIQKATLLQALEDRYEPQSIFLLNSVFLASALTADYDHPSLYSNPADQKTLATPFFERARMVLDFCIGVPRVSTVQGLLLLSRYPKIAGLGTSYLQHAILMSMDLGLHRKCDKWIPDEGIREARKRLFWCVYAVDSAAASILGRKPMIDDHEIDVPMLVPSTSEGDIEYTNTLYLVHMCKLWSIFRNVKQYIFNAVEVQDMVAGSLPKTYEQQLIQWQLQLPAALCFTSDVKAGDAEAMYNARGGVAQMLYENILILLHKPYLSATDPQKRSAYRSQEVCLKAASKITDIARVIVKTYTRTFEITTIPEGSMVNAVRIQVMYMKSSDLKVAEQCRNDFDYLLRFLREFYSSPRANLDDQAINCILAFLDEFWQSVRGIGGPMAHSCMNAIKNVAMAKKQRSVASYKQHCADTRNLSRLVKIGREERAKARGNSVTPPTLAVRDVAWGPQKRNSDSQYANQPLFDVPQQQQQQYSQPQQQREGSLALSTPSNEESDSPPGKFQKVSQYIGPFVGSMGMESFHQFRMTSAILNQPPSAIPLNNIMASTDGVFHAFNQQQQEQHLGYSHCHHQHHHQQSPPSQDPSLFADPSSQSGSNVFSPTFWNDFTNPITTQAGTQTVDPVVVPTTLVTEGNVGGGLLSSDNMYGMAAPNFLSAMQQQQQQQQQHQHQHQQHQHHTVDKQVSGSTTNVMEETLSAEQIQVLLDQALGEDTPSVHNHLADPSGSLAFHSQGQPSYPHYRDS